MERPTDSAGAGIESSPGLRGRGGANDGDGDGDEYRPCQIKSLTGGVRKVYYRQGI